MLRDQYRKTFAFLKTDIRKTYLICLAVFMIIFVLAACLTYFLVGIDGLERLLSGFGDTVDVKEEKTWYDFLLQNGRSNLIAVLSGLIPLLFIPGILMVGNAAIGGFAVGGFALAYELSLVKSFFVGIAPHGVLEYAADLLGFALGILLCKRMIEGLRNKTLKATLPEYLINSLRVYILVILPVLLIAGIVESTITPIVMDWLM